jgi:hypothetical protein
MPTFTESHIKVTVLGTAWNGTETWQFGVNCRHLDGVPPTDAGLLALATALAQPTMTMLTSTASLMSADARLTAIKCALVGTDGKYPAASTPGIYTYATPVAGVVSQGGIPQATMAVTLLTNIPRGRASRGRFFMPLTNVAVAADGRITAAQADAMEAIVKVWLNAIIADANVTAILVMSGLGAGTSGVVNAIGVGRVVDTMRSRRRSLLEQRTPLTI